MERGVRKVLGHSFCSGSRIPITVVKRFSTAELCFFFKKVLDILSLGFDALWGNCSSEEINLSSTKIAFVHCQFKACLLNAFECRSQVSDEMISVVGCDADIVHILGALIRFDNFIKVFSHEARECR